VRTSRGAEFSVVEKGEQDPLAVADLLVKDAAAGAGLAWAAAPVVGEALGLGGLPGGQACGEVVQLGPGEPGQRWVGQPLDEGGPRGPQIAIEEGQQGRGGGEPDRGHSGVMVVVFEDLAGLADQVPDAGGSDFEQVSEHVHGAHLPLVEQGEQDAGGIIEQRPGADVPGGGITRGSSRTAWFGNRAERPGLRRTACPPRWSPADGRMRRSWSRRDRYLAPRLPAPQVPARPARSGPAAPLGASVLEPERADGAACASWTYRSPSPARPAPHSPRGESGGPSGVSSSPRRLARMTASHLVDTPSLR
jgi:hypothetical protein